MAGAYKKEGEGNRPGKWETIGVEGPSGSWELEEGVHYRVLKEGEKEGLEGKKDKGKEVDRSGRDTEMGLGDRKNLESMGLGDSKHAGYVCENKRRKGEKKEGDIKEEGLTIDGWADKEERRILGKIREEELKKKEDRRSFGKKNGVEMKEGENMIRDHRRWKLKVSKIAEVLEVEVEEAMFYNMDIMLRNVLKEELEGRVAVEGGRSYREVVVGGKLGMKSEEVRRLEEKKEKEREVERVACMEREKRLENIVEVVLDSQDESLKEGEKWDVGAVGKALGLEEGVIKEISGKGNRVRIRCDSEKGVEEVKTVKKEIWEEVMRRKVVQMKNLDQWVGIVILGVELKVWDGKLKDLRRKVELENNIKLMKDLVWLVHPVKVKGMRLERVGVVCYVAKESLRQELLKEGIVGGNKKVEVKRFVGNREVQWCTKCAVVGHS
ncbi:hypothetical protein L873DRAFT_1847220 [Choiromyces venosus 120613-1]|uniref:Uncharacterized protein n=1 Tax=Choiromyces venosus 120613-1 TaxID=1336337 RepID=A0A3N4J8V2_9PEZI|nr:hypothetical protein L873DRAFT_1847220 [Choiromyces venosus 120613-1]